MSCTGHWLVPELSLISEAERELDRRVAARMPQADLAALADRLIVDWYVQRELVNRCLKKVNELEVELLLSQSTTDRPDDWNRYLEMAEELLGGHPS